MTALGFAFATTRAKQLAGGGVAPKGGFNGGGTGRGNREEWLFWFASSPAYFNGIRHRYLPQSSVGAGGDGNIL